MSNELIIALGGVVIAVLTYFAGAHRTEKRLNKQASIDRIDSAVNQYLDLRRSGKDSGWSAALKSGFANLENDREIREAARIIEGHGEKNPLSTHENIESVNLKVLFEYVAKNRLGFNNNPLNLLIEQANA